MTYEEKLQAEVASKGSFLDMIGGGSAGPQIEKKPEASVHTSKPSLVL